MKSSLFITILIAASTANIFSQENFNLYSTGDADTNDVRFNRIYHLFIADRDKEIHQLWKLNVMSIGFVNLNLAYEKGFGNKFSVETYLKAKAQGYIGGYIYNYMTNSIQLSASQNIKYYYNLDRRKRLGQQINGFTGDYFSLGCFAAYTARNYTGNDTISWYIIENDTLNYKNKHSTETHFGLNLLYGLQRRIGNIGYVEGYVGIQGLRTNRPDLYNGREFVFKPIVGIRAGFAIESFRELKKALRYRL